MFASFRYGVGSCDKNLFDCVYGVVLMLMSLWVLSCNPDLLPQRLVRSALWALICRLTMRMPVKTCCRQWVENHVARCEAGLNLWIMSSYVCVRVCVWWMWEVLWPGVKRVNGLVLWFMSSCVCVIVMNVSEISSPGVWAGVLSSGACQALCVCV